VPIVHRTGTRTRRPAIAPLAALWAALLIAFGLVVPVLAVEGPTKLFDPSTSPTSGLPTTTIHFAVSYRNREGSPADRVVVIIDGVAHEMTGAGSTWKQGVRLTWSTTLPVGVHTVSFEAADARKFSDQIAGASVTITAPPSPSPTPTAKATPTPTPKPEPTATPAPKPTPTPASTPTTTATPAPTRSPAPGPTASPTSSPSSGGGSGALGDPGGSGGTTPDGSGATTPGDSSGWGGTSGTGGSDISTRGGSDGSGGSRGAVPGGMDGSGGGDRAWGDGGGGRAGGANVAPEGGSTAQISNADPDGGGIGGGVSDATSGGGSNDSGIVSSGPGWGGLARALELLGISKPPAITAIPMLVGTSGAVSMAFAFAIFGKKRRDGQPPAPDEVLQANAARGHDDVPRGDAATAVVRGPAVPPPADAEAGMPRWRRPSLLAARKADPARYVATTPKQSFDGGPVGALDGHERRIIRYRVVRLLDAPDELRSAEIGQLDQGDEVQLLERSGTYWLVLCPDGRQGWLHKMTLGELVSEAAAANPRTSDVDDDVLSAFIQARARA
jgi:hypothetical protein